MIRFGRVLSVFLIALCVAGTTRAADLEHDSVRVKKSVSRALDWLARQQHRRGYWEANQGQYRVAMTALSGTALLAEGSTTTRGKYARNIRLAVDYLCDLARPNGLIGYKDDYRYTYGHGFSMVFLSQVFGEEEDEDRRKILKRVLEKAVQFCGEAQTSKGGWGYVSAKDGNDFDEGSTCVTQVQGLRACRNAGIPVSKEIIDDAHEYIRKCMTPDGGIQYSLQNRGGARPPITAAAVATMFSTGEYDSDQVKKMLAYCEKHVWPGGGQNSVSGHWHYAHFYYAQVMYRKSDEDWRKYFNDVGRDIIAKQSSAGDWREGYVGPVYTTAINATILQLGNAYLPIYQR